MTSTPVQRLVQGVKDHKRRASLSLAPSPRPHLPTLSFADDTFADMLADEDDSDAHKVRLLASSPRKPGRELTYRSAALPLHPGSRPPLRRQGGPRRARHRPAWLNRRHLCQRASDGQRLDRRERRGASPSPRSPRSASSALTPSTTDAVGQLRAPSFSPLLLLLEALVLTHAFATGSRRSRGHPHPRLFPSPRQDLARRPVGHHRRRRQRVRADDGRQRAAREGRRLLQRHVPRREGEQVHLRERVHRPWRSSRPYSSRKCYRRRLCLVHVRPDLSR